MKKTLAILLISFLSFAAGRGFATLEIDKEAEKCLRELGLSEQLDAGVRVTQQEKGLISIKDEGTYLTHYTIMGPSETSDANIIIDAGVEIPVRAKNLVVVTHGWLDKATTWPEEMAKEIHGRVDVNEWVCISYDWHGGALVANPLDAVKYAKGIAGPRLAKAILELQQKPEHIHFIGHSAGSWVIDTACQIICEKSGANIHLTYLDAYVPKLGDIKELKGPKKSKRCWAEHYYTKDITLEMTSQDLDISHNVDLSDIDPGINEHEFPYRWYLATITGHYELFREKNCDVVKNCEGFEYGFAMSKEFSDRNWQKSLKLKRGNKAIEMRKPEEKKNFWDKL